MKVVFWLALVSRCYLYQAMNDSLAVFSHSDHLKDDTMRELTIINQDYLTTIATIDTQISTYLSNQQLIEGTDFTLAVYDLKSPLTTASLSSIDLGYCEGVLRETLTDDNGDIVIAKFDVSRPNSVSPQVEYKLYTTNGAATLPIPSLLCQAYNITLSLPISNKQQLPQYIKAKQYRADFNVDILNSHHSVYTDHCLPFSPEGIDTILLDRRADYYQSPLLCEPKCNYQRIDYSTDRIICKCPFKASLSTRITQNEPQSLPTPPGSYFQIISCTKLLTLWRTFSFNTGMLVLITIILIQVVLIFSFLLCGMPELNMRLRESKQSKKEPRPPKKPFYADKKEFVNYFARKENLKGDARLNKVKSVFFEKEAACNVFDMKPHKESSEKVKDYTKDDESYFYRVPAQRDNYLYYTRKPKEEMTAKNEVFSFKEIGDDLNSEDLSKEKSLSVIGSERKLDGSSNGIAKYSPNDMLLKYNSNQNIKDINEDAKAKEVVPNKPKLVGYKDYRYEYSLEHDKRSYCLVWWYTLTEREIFCAIFTKKSKFELKSIKLSVCLLNIALDLFFNCFYYSDTLISNKYHNGGSLSFVQLIIKAIVSSLSAGVINIIMGWLFMYVKHFEVLSLEYIKEDKYRAYSLNFLQAIQSKVMTAFVIELIVLTFCLYYTTVFCGVYPKTQTSVFIGVGVSLLFELAFIFMMSVIVSCMRYCGVRRQKKVVYYSSIYLKNRI